MACLPLLAAVCGFTTRNWHWWFSKWHSHSFILPPFRHSPSLMFADAWKAQGAFGLIIIFFLQIIYTQEKISHASKPVCKWRVQAGWKLGVTYANHGGYVSKAEQFSHLELAVECLGQWPAQGWPPRLFRVLWESPHAGAKVIRRGPHRPLPAGGGWRELYSSPPSWRWFIIWVMTNIQLRLPFCGSASWAPLDLRGCVLQKQQHSRSALLMPPPLFPLETMKGQQDYAIPRVTPQFQPSKCTEGRDLQFDVWETCLGSLSKDQRTSHRPAALEQAWWDAAGGWPSAALSLSSSTCCPCGFPACFPGSACSYHFQELSRNMISKDWVHIYVKEMLVYAKLEHQESASEQVDFLPALRL